MPPFRSITRSLPSTIFRAVRQPSLRRNLNTADAPVIYSAAATVKGARDGHVAAESLNVDLTMAKALGKQGDTSKTNPEELFAAGYGACFQ
jgi:organic hydroperoxide reductase OsmC/OhrA